MRRTVLIVDDHAGFRTAAPRAARGRGFVVVGDAADDDSALATARALRPAIVRVDVQLPDIDGFAVAELLAESEDLRRSYSRRAATSRRSAGGWRKTPLGVSSCG
jgi:DNA-binding NarL/FixJ family response regulator